MKGVRIVYSLVVVLSSSKPRYNIEMRAKDFVKRVAVFDSDVEYCIKEDTIYLRTSLNIEQVFALKDAQQVSDTPADADYKPYKIQI